MGFFKNTMYGGSAPVQISAGSQTSITEQYKIDK